jgi:excisionase family DNA binding protein
MSSTTHDGPAVLEDVATPMPGNQAPKPNSVEARSWSGPQEEVEMEACREVEDIFISPDDVMRYLKIGRSMCYELLADGTIPSYRVGRLRRVKKSDIAAWLDTRRYAPWE